MKGHTWFKIILFVAPLLLLIFFYIRHEQRVQTVQMKKLNASFSRSWNEFNYQFTGNRVYKRRAEKRTAELRRIRKRAVEKKAAGKESAKKLDGNIENEMKNIAG